MTTLFTSSVTVLFSLLCLLLLVLSDPKRHRRSAVPIAVSPGLRLTAGLLSLIPGIFLVVLGEYSSLLIWLGSVTILGWALAVLPPRFF